MAACLRRAGHRVVAASAVSQGSIERVADRLPGVPVLRPEEVIERADLILLTVPDDALAGLVAGLAATDVPLGGKLIAHASGRHGLGVLDPVVAKGALPLAMHPVMTFTGRVEDEARMNGISFGVTAPGPLRPVAEVLVVEMGGEPVFIAEDKRGIYHAALASGANHLVTLVTASAEMLGLAGVEDPATMLAPLLYAALENALAFGPAALTGPVARGDAETVAAHVAAIKAAAPEMLSSYLALARLTADRALAARTLTADDAERLLGVLSGPPA
jgi:predicted short-subunit dehydrogenase-like oxidoreductase (DUF2520 family)